MNNGIGTWLRWIAILPAAILASILFRYLFYYIQVFSNAESSVVIPFISTICSAYGFMSVGVKVAPYHKKYVAVVLLILFFIILIGSVWEEINAGKDIIFSTLAGSLIGIIGTFEYERRRRQN